jgi:hypothetical protein
MSLPPPPTTAAIKLASKLPSLFLTTGLIDRITKPAAVDSKRWRYGAGECMASQLAAAVDREGEKVRGPRPGGGRRREGAALKP